jgi:hypothetical protein
MPKYIIFYIGGNQPSGTEESKRNSSKYMDWLSALGDKAISPANPFKNTSTIHPDRSVKNESSTSMSGYTIIEVDSMEEALEIAKVCPFLDIGGKLEVSELVQMSDKK